MDNVTCRQSGFDWPRVATSLSIQLYEDEPSRDQDDLKSPEGSSSSPTREGLSGTPPRESSYTPSQQRSKTLRRKRGGKIGEYEENKLKITSLLTSAVTMLQGMNKIRVQPQPKKHRLFAEFIAHEMEALEDEEIIDDLKN